MRGLMTRDHLQGHHDPAPLQTIPINIGYLAFDLVGLGNVLGCKHHAT
jgi:hypothetical protein